MRKGSKYTIEEGRLRHEGPDAADWVRDLAEIIKEHGGTDDPKIIFEARAEQLRRRAIDELKAQASPRKAGRPMGELVNVDELIARRGKVSRKAFAHTLGMNVNSLERIEKTGRASRKNKLRIDRKKSPRKPH